MNLKSEFKNYAVKHLNIPSNKLWDLENSMTPYILEEREMRATQMDIFSQTHDGKNYLVCRSSK